MTEAEWADTEILAVLLRAARKSPSLLEQFFGDAGDGQRIGEALRTAIVALENDGAVIPPEVDRELGHWREPPAKPPRNPQDEPAGGVDP